MFEGREGEEPHRKVPLALPAVPEAHQQGNRRLLLIVAGVRGVRSRGCVRSLVPLALVTLPPPRCPSTAFFFLPFFLPILKITWWAVCFHASFSSSFIGLHIDALPLLAYTRACIVDFRRGASRARSWDAGAARGGQTDVGQTQTTRQVGVKVTR